MLALESSGSIAYIKMVGYASSVAYFSYLNIPTEQVGILAVLMVIDFITWIGKQYRVDKTQIKSHLAWLGVIKKVATLITVLSVALVMKWLDINDGKYVSSILWIFIMAEGYSTIQNVYAIRTGKILPEFDVISLLIKEVWDFFKRRIDGAVRTAFRENK